MILHMRPTLGLIVITGTLAFAQENIPTPAGIKPKDGARAH